MKLGKVARYTITYLTTPGIMGLIGAGLLIGGWAWVSHERYQRRMTAEFLRGISYGNR